MHPSTPPHSLPSPTHPPPVPSALTIPHPASPCSFPPGSLISGSYFAVATALTYGLNFALPPGVIEQLPILGGMEPVARIWMGVVLGAVCQFSVLSTYIAKWDWQEQARKAAQRTSVVAAH